MNLDFLKSKFFIAVGSTALILLLYSLALQLNKSYVIHKEISDLQSQIDHFQSQNDEMLKLIAYLKTPEYQVRQARPLLNLQKPGEFAVALPPVPDDQTGATAASKPAANQTASNLRAWWDYIFAPH
jgi:hypothetical protein